MCTSRSIQRVAANLEDGARARLATSANKIRSTWRPCGCRSASIASRCRCRVCATTRPGRTPRPTAGNRRTATPDRRSPQAPARAAARAAATRSTARSRRGQARPHGRSCGSPERVTAATHGPRRCGRAGGTRPRRRPSCVAASAANTYLALIPQHQLPRHDSEQSVYLGEIDSARFRGTRNPHSIRELARQPCPKPPRAAELRSSKVLRTSSCVVMLCVSVIVVPSSHRSIGLDRRVWKPAMTGASRDPGTSANFRYTTSTDMTYPYVGITQ